MAKKTVPAADPAVEAVPEDARSENAKDLETYRDETAKRLALTPKRKIRVPLPKGVSKGKDARRTGKLSTIVGINGYNYQIRLGEQVDVPEEVAKILERANKI
jgi:hypothetical protein